jgi:hypothetical protein
MGKHGLSVDSSVLKRIKSRKSGWVFTPIDFVDLGSRTAVASALMRYKANGCIRQLRRGYYALAKKNRAGNAKWPDLDSIATAIQRKYRLRLLPAGAYAAYLLGLQIQVPAKITFLTDGDSRALHFGPLLIILKRTAPRNLIVANRPSGLIIQAFKYIGQAKINSGMLHRLGKTLQKPDRGQVHRDMEYAPAWMHDLLLKLVRSDHEKTRMPRG